MSAKVHPAKKAVSQIDLPEQVQRMLESQDFCELQYHEAERIRKQRRKTDKEIAKLQSHDEDENRILTCPEAVLREAHRAIDRGTELLLKLIRSKKLLHTFRPTETGKAAGIEPFHTDDALDCFASRVSFLNRQLIRLAEQNVPRACRNLWFQSRLLAEAFTRLALVFPKEFREVAETSLTMPSLRSQSPKFTADAQAIAAAIHLGHKHPAPGLHDNRERVGALCHYLVSRIVEDIEYARWEYKERTRSFERLKGFSETAEEYRNISLKEWLRSTYHPSNLLHLEASASLGELHEKTNDWWSARVLPMLRNEFERLKREPNRNFALWTELQRGGERNTPNDMRRYLEKICRNKLTQIAKARKSIAHKQPARGQTT